LIEIFVLVYPNPGLIIIAFTIFPPEITGCIIAPDPDPLITISGKE
jgi:hypothetical protein